MLLVTITITNKNKKLKVQFFKNALKTKLLNWKTVIWSNILNNSNCNNVYQKHHKNPLEPNYGRDNSTVYKTIRLIIYM